MLKVGEEAESEGRRLKGNAEESKAELRERRPAVSSSSSFLSPSSSSSSSSLLLLRKLSQSPPSCSAQDRQPLSCRRAFAVLFSFSFSFFFPLFHSLFLYPLSPCLFQNEALLLRVIPNFCLFLFFRSVLCSSSSVAREKLTSRRGRSFAFLSLLSLLLFSSLLRDETQQFFLLLFECFVCSLHVRVVVRSFLLLFLLRCPLCFLPLLVPSGCLRMHAIRFLHTRLYTRTSAGVRTAGLSAETEAKHVGHEAHVAVKEGRGRHDD